MTTGISWTDETWNPVVGCTKASPGCAHCYAEVMAKRLRAMGRPEYQQVHDGEGWTGQTVCLPERLTQPLHWRKPREIFVCSMADLFHESVPFEFIAAVWGVMAATPQHRYQVLTKRPERMVEWYRWIATQTHHREAWVRVVNDAERGNGDPVGSRGAESSTVEGMACHENARSIVRGTVSLRYKPWPLPNVYLGTTVEDQDHVRRIPNLLRCPAAGHFVSLEPLLGPVDLRPYLSGLAGIIVGGESGPGARPMHPGWVRSLRDQCAGAGVAFHFKQWGKWAPLALPWFADYEATAAPSGLAHWPEGGGVKAMLRVGKHAAGRMLDGRTHDDLPWRGVDRG